MFYVYALHSKKDGKLYTGYSPDLKNRLKSHESGFVTATKYRRPLILIARIEDASRHVFYKLGLK
jgi:putative endonuclease